MSSSTNTERVERTEAALRQSEAIKTAILEAALDGIVTIDHEGHVLDFNPAAERMFGFTRNEAVGREMADLIIPPRLRDRHRAGLLRAVSTGQDTIVGQRIEITAVRKGGEEFPVELAITRIRTGDGPLFTGHIRDISERKRAEAQLRESQQLLASITHNITDGIYRRLADGTQAFVNEALLRMFGYASLNEVSKVAVDAHYVWPERRAELLALLERNGQFKHEEVEFCRKDGSTFWGLVSAIAVRDAGSGEIAYSDGAISDITDRKQAELRRATQFAVTRTLAEAGTLDEAAPKILQEVCESLRWDFAAFWRIDSEQTEMRCVRVWHVSSDRLAGFARATGRSTFAIGVGLPGRVWASGEPRWIHDVTHDPNFPRAPLADHTGLHSAFAFPIRLGRQVLGVVEFFSHDIREPDVEVLEMFAAIGSQIGQFIERKRAEDELRSLNADLERRIVERTAELVAANDSLRSSEARLRESEERFSKAFRASPVFVSIARMSDGKFIEVNEAFLQSSGWSRQEVIGRTSAELKLWANLEERGSVLLELELRGFIRNRECSICSKDGRTDTVLLSAERIDIDGKPHILAVGLDITTRKQAEEEMRRALEQERELSQLKSSFVSLVSHEFRTPLGIIMSAAEILEHYLERLTPERRREHLHDIHDACRRMSGLMDEVLLLARMEAGKTQCKPSSLDLRVFCQRLVEETMAATGGLCTVQFSAKRFSQPAQGDQSLLRHIFTNLLNNAVKYSPPGQTVHFTVEQRESAAVFEVRDHGIGISESDQVGLFETFHRGRNVGERPGTGLGLVIVKRCVALHGGSIELRSKENEGTAVTVHLPLFPLGKTSRGRTRPTQNTETRENIPRPGRRPTGRRKQK